MRSRRSGAIQDNPVEVQDKARQDKLRRRCGLRDSGQGRMGADAVDQDGNEFELKSAGGKNVTTARDVGPHTIEKWKGRYWIIARGPNLKAGFRIDQIYILHPKDLGGWWSKNLEPRFDKDQAVLSRAKRCLKKANFPKESMKRLRYLVLRGMTLNNPKIPWDYVCQHGKDVTKRTPESVREFVRSHPI